MRSMFLRMATDTSRRILVHLKKSSDGDVPIPAKFTQSILDYFGCTEHKGRLSAELANNKVILSDADSTSCVKIKRPPFCPIHNLDQSDISKLSDDIVNRGVDVGAAVILHTGDNKILLTRRARHLRTFPKVWVPPGGHIEENETIVEAGLRELQEETGLQINQMDLVGKDAPVLALWESTYPPTLNLGLPKRHHLVIYLLAKLESTVTSERLQKHISLEPDEVEASVWLDRQMVEAITVATEKNTPDCQPNKHVPSEIQGTVVKDRQQEITVLPIAPLFECSTSAVDIERVSTGTKFVLEEWLKVT